MRLASLPIEELPGTRSQTIKRLKSLGIETIADLIRHVPFRYDDYRTVKLVSDLREGDQVTVQGSVTSTRTVRTRNKMTIQRVTLADATGSIEMSWFNQPFVLNILTPGRQVSIAGIVKRFGSSLTLEPKEYEVLQNNQSLRHSARLVPVYPAAYGITSRLIREKILTVFDQLLAPGDLAEFEFLPEKIRNKYSLASAEETYRRIHFPETADDPEISRRRLAFDELFLTQFSSLLVRKEWEKQKVGNPLDITSSDKKDAIYRFINNLPFKLTGAQKRVIDEILIEMAREKPMNRFVQGDVGSGKTVVAAVAAFATWLNGYQTVVMAPTEILALQHFSSFEKLFVPAGVETGLWTRNYKQLDPANLPPVIVGTHALLTQKITFDRVALVVIDEQHRFGVAQRALLKEKGMNPHLLTMTATPIPRTVALTIYGELDMSVIDEMPDGRLPIKTHVIHEKKRSDGYRWIREQILNEGVQAYVICPLVEESEAETMQSVKAANREYEYLKTQVFPDLRIALIHGKMKSKEKDAVMTAFKNHDYDILVSTSVVEVGIDVPNATIMLIEGAERYGLAQLHQLRGRVGRGNKQSYCFLFPSKGSNPYSERLRFFAATTSGMKLAEYDLEHRGAGEIYGTRQSGTEDLRFASLSDLPLIEHTRAAAESLLSEYTAERFPALAERISLLRTSRIAKD
ncbi:MAG: ATP-dependent DNA helicase RecG [Patescibacteria group bacterium]|nr:ATP-dependent DNA helicase RecG [Patescibacteria group bacterium]